MNSVVKQQQLDWRRSQVLELSSRGYNQREISSKLGVDAAAVNRDIHFLKQQARDNLQHHIYEVLPEEYQKCMTGLKRNLNQTLEIADTVSDPRTKLQARAFANDCYNHIMDLVTNGVVVSESIRYIQSKVDQLDLKREGQGKDSNQKQNEEKPTPTAIPFMIDEGKTTNGVF